MFCKIYGQRLRGWLLAFAGTESGTGEAREIDCGMNIRHDAWMILRFEEKKFHWLLSSCWPLTLQKCAPLHLVDCGKRLWQLVLGEREQ